MLIRGAAPESLLGNPHHPLSLLCSESPGGPGRHPWDFIQLYSFSATNLLHLRNEPQREADSSPGTKLELHPPAPTASSGLISTIAKQASPQLGQPLGLGLTWHDQAAAILGFRQLPLRYRALSAGNEKHESPQHCLMSDLPSLHPANPHI